MDNRSNNITDTAKGFAKIIFDNYWQPLREAVKKQPDLLRTMPGFLVNPEKIVIYFDRKHVAVEYYGQVNASEVLESGAIQVDFHDLSNKANLFQEIVGFEFESSAGLHLTLPRLLENHIAPTTRGFKKMTELNWNFGAQDSIISINTGNLVLEEGAFTRVVNSFYFDEQNGFLKTRNIRWLDCYPIGIREVDDAYIKVLFHNDIFTQQLEKDPQYIFPKVHDYRFSKLQKLNRFIELISREGILETDITHYLSLPENSFILTMSFFAVSISGQVSCEWQSDLNNAIRPDFFITQPNGYSNILEFKLPSLKNKTVVGTSNRESFSAELNSYISQVRVYKKYFDDPNNRRWLFDNHQLRVEAPKKILVIGRRYNFENTEWKEITADYRDLEILTYDDIIDGLLAQLYRE